MLAVGSSHSFLLDAGIKGNQPAPPHDRQGKKVEVRELAGPVNARTLKPGVFQKAQIVWPEFVMSGAGGGIQKVQCDLGTDGLRGWLMTRKNPF